MISFLDDRHATKTIDVSGPLLLDLAQEVEVDIVDDLQVTAPSEQFEQSVIVHPTAQVWMVSSVPRQKLLKQRHRPALERLGQHRMVGVRERALADCPSIVPLSRHCRAES